MKIGKAVTALHFYKGYVGMGIGISTGNGIGMSKGKDISKSLIYVHTILLFKQETTE